MSMKHLLLVGVLALLAACSSNAPVIDESLSESELYRKAQTDLDAENYGSAVETLRALEARYPFGRYAEQAQLELIYAYYQNYEPEAATASADRFIRLPSNQFRSVGSVAQEALHVTAPHPFRPFLGYLGIFETDFKGVAHRHGMILHFRGFRNQEPLMSAATGPPDT